MGFLRKKHVAPEVIVFPVGARALFKAEDKERVWGILLETRNISETARQLECSRHTIRRFMRKYPHNPEYQPRYVSLEEKARFSAMGQASGQARLHKALENALLEDTINIQSPILGLIMKQFPQIKSYFMEHPQAVPKIMQILNNLKIS